MSLMIIPEGSVLLMQWSLGAGDSHIWTAPPNGAFIDPNRPKNRKYITLFTTPKPHIFDQRGDIRRIDVQVAPDFLPNTLATVLLIRTKQGVIGWTDAPLYVSGAFYYTDDWVMTNPFELEPSMVPIMEDTRAYLEAVTS
jgi:hypothetical protein